MTTRLMASLPGNKSMRPNNECSPSPTHRTASYAMRLVVATSRSLVLIHLTFSRRVDMPQLVYTLAEFLAMHGGSGVDDSGSELLPDEARITSMGGAIDPPADPDALLRTKRRYVELKLQQEERKWKAFKA